MDHNLAPREIDQIKSHGLSVEKVEDQLQIFKKGIDPVNVIRPASINDGILAFSEDELEDKINRFDSQAVNLELAKFTPASGAASRMFRALQSWLNGERNDENEMAKDQFFGNRKKFAFWPFLEERMKKAEADINDPEACIKFTLADKGLNLSFRPKALIPFHSYSGDIRTAAEEHLVEANAYSVGRDNKAILHFTLSDEHVNDFYSLIEENRSKYETNGVRFEISHSLQSKSTDTVAVNPDNTLFKDEAGNLVFRPAGHGALLDNLKNVKSDIIFIKNIDNVVSDHLKLTGNRYKKLLASHLIDLKVKIDQYLTALLENDSSIALEEMSFFLKEHFNLNVESDKKRLIEIFDRPLRVCGMVKNEGEPGGGSFWIRDSEGKESLQIVEKAEIDLSKSENRQLLEKSTHFNPVDLVVNFKRFDGSIYNLDKYRDDSRAFISEKSKNGKALKALELPGLWNGAMANWNTVFVEVPLETFAPVKTVNDLLKPAHQPK